MALVQNKTQGRGLKFAIAQGLVKPFKAIPFAGRFRFWCLYQAYRITGWHIRHLEWDFVLRYFPKLGDWQWVNVMDVGCCRNLFVHELVARGYRVSGIDLEEFNGRWPGKHFYKRDVTSIHNTLLTSPDINEYFHFVTCISVLEHIPVNRRRAAVENMVKMLKAGGRLILTIPTLEFAQGHPWPGFTHSGLVKLLPMNSQVIHCSEAAGQFLIVIERLDL